MNRRRKALLYSLCALLALCTLLPGTALAAEWPEGRSAAKPYANVPEVNLEESMGYILPYPSEALPAENYCDRLMLYLPREDLSLGQGVTRLCDETGVLETIDIEEEGAALLRPLEEEELTALHWGGGTCIEIQLPTSLELAHPYYVEMDEGCFVTEGGLTASLDEWRFELGGEYGVENLRLETDGDDETEKLRFNLTLGGTAMTATLFSEDDSVCFDQIEYDQSAEVVAELSGDAPNWGIVFENRDGEAFDVLTPGR